MPTEAASPIANPMLPAILIFFIFYFLVFKPKNDKEKKQKKEVKNLKKNDQVVTVGGIHGTVVLVKEKTVVLRVDDNVKIEFDKDSVSAITKAKG